MADAPQQTPFEQGGSPLPMPQAPQGGMPTPGAGGGVLPPASPVGAPQADPTQALLQQSTVHSQQAGALYDALMNNISAQTNLSKGMEALQGKLAWHPSFRGLHDPASSPVGNLFHDIGQGLIAAGSATRPGQAVEGAMFAGPRSEYAAKAKELEALKGTGEELQRAYGGAVSGEWRPFTAAGAYTRGQAALQGVQERATSALQRHQVDMDRIAAMKDINQQRLAAQELMRKMTDETAREVAGIRANAGIDEAQILSGSREGVANLIQQANPSFFGFLKDIVGITPAQIQGGPEVSRPATPPPRGPQGKGETTPPRPPGVPAGAKWDSKTRRWRM